MSACAQVSLAVYDSFQQDQESIATLELQDAAMFFEEVKGMQVSGEQIHQKDLPMTVRSLNLLPGTYQLSILFKHLAQPTCWKKNGTEYCWAVRDRGWWLPGATLIPATIKLEVEPGKTYVVTQVANYWDMPEQREWFPMIVSNTP